MGACRQVHSQLQRQARLYYPQQAAQAERAGRGRAATAPTPAQGAGLSPCMGVSRPCLTFLEPDFELGRPQALEGGHCEPLLAWCLAPCTDLARAIP